MVYNDEHILLRLNYYLPSFHSGARYRSIDEGLTILLGRLYITHDVGRASENAGTLIIKMRNSKKL